MTGGDLTRREIWLVAAVCLPLGLALDISLYPATLEDAFITFRYSEHFAEGYGMGAWNHSGEPVEGYTSLLWMLVLAAAHGLGASVVTASKWLGILCHLGAAGLCFAVAGGRRAGPLGPTGATVLGAFLALYLPACWYATSGMETSLFVAGVTLMLFASGLPGAWFWVGAAGALLVLTRPEGIVVASAGWMAFALQSRSVERSSALAAAPIAAAALGVLSYRIALFGDWAPNTYWAKVAGASFWQHAHFGWAYLADWSANHVALLALAVLGSIWALRRSGNGSETRDWRDRSRALLIPGLVLFYAIYIVKVGGDNHFAFPYWRHLLHILPLVVALAAAGCAALGRGRPRLQLTLAIGVLVWSNLSVHRWDSGELTYDLHGRLAKQMLKGVADFPPLTHAPPNGYIRWLDAMTDENAVIASSFGGQLPYVVDAIHIDALGLNTRHIARHGRFDPDGPLDSKSDMRWVLDQRPDIIEGYFSGRRILKGHDGREIVDNWRRQMNLDLVTSPQFRREYLFVRNGPYGAMDRALFLRRSYWESHPQRARLDCVPVSRTSLAANWRVTRTD